jgi:hypothetical protein
VRRFKKFQAAVFHEWDIPPRQLELEYVAVMRAAEQHRLTLQGHAALARFENARDDVLGLGLIVGDRHVMRRVSKALSRAQHLAVLPRAFAHQDVRRVEHALRGAVVVFECDDRCGTSVVWHVLIGKPQDVIDRCRAK